MSKILVPVGQKRLTNVAIVRLKAGGKRFEIACYKNKVLNWREGVEKDLEEVIQIDTIFENVSKGVVAKEKDLSKAFGTTNCEEICRRILKTGELQVSDREREVHLESIFRDIVQIVADRCIHAQTGRLHTANAVENALKSVGFSVHPDHAAKKQALKAMEQLCKDMPNSFARARMRLRIVCPERLLVEVRRHLVEEASATIEQESGGGAGGNGAPASEAYAISFTCDPRQYRELDKFVTVVHAQDGLSLQIVTSAVVADVCSVDDFAGPLSGSTSTLGTATADAAPAVPPRQQQEKAGYPSSGAAACNSNSSAPKRLLRCSSCSAEFEDANAYRCHCRSDWHNFNLKRKVKSLPPVSEEEFQEINLDSREGFLGGD